MANFLEGLAAQTFARALALHKAGEPEKAEVIYRMVLEIDPEHEEATEALLIARMQRGELAAIVEYRTFVSENPRRDAALYLMLGTFEMILGQVGLARLSFRRAIVLAPESAEAWMREGRAAMLDGMLRAEAVRCLLRAAHLTPDDASVLRDLGDIQLKTGLVEPALKHFGQALAVGNTAETRASIGRSLLAFGDAASALMHFDEAVRLDPDQRDSLLGGAQALLAMGRRDEAAARLNSLVGRFAGRAADLTEISSHLLDAGHPEDALRAYRAGMADNPKRSPNAEPAVLRRRPAAELCAERSWPYHRVQAAHRAHLIDDIGQHHNVTFPEIFLARVDDARISTSTWAVACGDTLLLDGLLHYDPDRLIRHPEFPCNSPTGKILADLEPPSATVEPEAILIGGVANWAHLVQEWLSRLTVLERFPELDRLPLLVSPHMMRSVRELMGLLGVDPSRIVTLPDVPVVRAERLWIPSLTHRHKYASPLHIDFLRRKLAPLIEEGMRRPRRRLYLSRRTATYRAIVNEREVLDALAPLGVEEVVPEDYSMAEQVALFASAELIVGPLGGGSAAILFAPPGAAFVELTHAQLAIPQYGMLTATLHQRYRRVIGRTLENRGTITFDFDFSVPPGAVAAACREMLDGAG
ncbi:glycosyltransferase 61 family protein [Azospirillum sp. sgz301742]